MPTPYRCPMDLAVSGTAQVRAVHDMHIGWAKLRIWAIQINYEYHSWETIKII